jgi:hypothetical protein
MAQLNYREKNKKKSRSITELQKGKIDIMLTSSRRRESATGKTALPCLQAWASNTRAAWPCVSTLGLQRAPT